MFTGIKIKINPPKFAKIPFGKSGENAEKNYGQEDKNKKRIIRRKKWAE